MKRILNLTLIALLSISMISCEKEKNPDGKDETGKSTMEAVDMGLSVKWATCNLGASNPEEYGDYYAWSETETKDNYTKDSSRYCKIAHFDATPAQYDTDGVLIKEAQEAHDEYRYTKYVKKSEADTYGYEGVGDDLTQLELSDDVANVKLGGKWRIPTEAEVAELMDNCTWQWTEYNGVHGYKVTSKKAGYTDKWIFLPAAGYRVETVLIEGGYAGHYWSSSLNTGYPHGALYMRFTSSYVFFDGLYRCFGQSVRPVSE